MTMTEDEMDRLAAKIAGANGRLAGVTPATAQERLSNLIRHDPEWANKVSAGEIMATKEFNSLTQMAHDHNEAQAAQREADARQAINQFQSTNKES